MSGQIDCNRIPAQSRKMASKQSPNTVIKARTVHENHAGLSRVRGSVVGVEIHLVIIDRNSHDVARSTTF